MKKKSKSVQPAVFRPAAACEYLGISRFKLHYLSETDPTFPRKIIFSSRCVGYRKESIDSWLNAKEEGAI